MASQPEEDNAEDEAPRRCGPSIVVADPAAAASVEATARLIRMGARRLAEHGGWRSTAAMGLTGSPIRRQVAGQARW
jgi:hypothetical protein